MPSQMLWTLADISMNPLTEAIFKGNITTAELFISKGMTVTICDNDDCPILAALNSENPAMMKFVLNNGANPNQYLGSGWTILHEAFDLAIDGMIQNRLDKPSDDLIAIIQLLLQSGASLENKSFLGGTPLESLNTYAGSEEVFERLKEYFRPVVPNIDSLIQYERRLT